MATFAYSGRTRGGQTVTGERIADTIDAAVSALRKEQILVTRITPSKEKGEEAAAGKKVKAGKSGKSVKAKNLAVFTRQFAVMIDAGLPLVQCLDILGSQEEDKNFSSTILKTRTDVESGLSLADAMRKHPKTFDPLFTNMVAAGEAGGILDTILKRLANYMQKAGKLTGQGKSGMIYAVDDVGVAADISRRGHRDRGARRQRHSLESHPDLRAAVRGPRRRTPAADARGHLDEQFAGVVLPVPGRGAGRLGLEHRDLLPHRQRPP